MAEEKKYGFFNPKPKLTVEKLAQTVDEHQKVVKDTLEQFSNLSDKKFSEIRQSIEEINLSLRSMRETHNIPQEWVDTISKMREFDPNLPELPVIYQVLTAYKSLSTNIAKANQDRTKQRLQDIRTQVQAKKIVNCVKCNKPLQEGEYYLFDAKPYCLHHKDEPISNQTTGEEML